MRVVVPYARLFPETRAAIEADGWTAEYEDVGGSMTAYHELFLRVWTEGRAFAIVEQDIVVWPGALAELEACPEMWCGFAYNVGTHYGAYLGCTRFSDELLRDHSGAAAAMDTVRPDGTPRRYWGRLDTRLKQVLEDREGVRMHVHWPAVGHLNPVKPTPIFNCLCGAGIPDEVYRLGPGLRRCPACGRTT